jgi:hypothetical protein
MPGAIEENTRSVGVNAAPTRLFVLDLNVGTFT